MSAVGSLISQIYWRVNLLNQCSPLPRNGIMNRCARLISDCFVYPLNAVIAGETALFEGTTQRDAEVDGHS